MVTKNVIIFYLFFTLLLPSLSKAQDSNEMLLDKRLETYYSKHNKKLYLRTDKNVYQHGEVIWLSGLMVNLEGHRIKETMDVEVAFQAEDDERTLTLRLLTKEGIFNGRIVVPDDFKEGKCKVMASIAGQKHPLFSTFIGIKKHVQPFFLVKASFQEKNYGQGDKLSVLLSVHDHDGSPLRAGYYLQVHNGTYNLMEDKGRCNKKGEATISFELPHIAPTDLKMTFLVSAGKFEEQLVVHIPIQSHNVSLHFFPEGKALVHGAVNQMKFLATNKWGEPFPFEGKVVNEKGEYKGEVKSDERGFGQLTFKPHINQKLHVVITSPYLVDRAYELPQVHPLGASFFLTEKEDALNCKIYKHLTKSHRFYFSVIHQGKKIFFKRLDLGSEDEFLLPKSKLKMGVNRLTLYDSLLTPLSEHLFFIPVAQDTHTLSISEDEFSPRERIDITAQGVQGQTILISSTTKSRLWEHLQSPSNIVSHLWIDSEIFSPLYFSPEELSHPDHVNDWLAFQLPSDSWEEIFAAEDKELIYQPFVQGIDFVAKAYPGIRVISSGMVHCLNYHYDPTYLKNNPKLKELLEQSIKEDKRIPPYRRMLESGSSLLEAIRSIKPYELINNQIVFFGGRNSLMAQQGALIYVDGLRTGTDISVLNTISPYDVDKIMVTTRAHEIMDYTALNSVGIIDITTKRGENTEEEVLNENFEAPDYGNTKGKGPTDLRTSLFWTPFRYEPNDVCQEHFYHSDIIDKVVTVMEGITKQGIPFYLKEDYVVEGLSKSK